MNIATGDEPVAAGRLTVEADEQLDDVGKVLVVRQASYITEIEDIIRRNRGFARRGGWREGDGQRIAAKDGKFAQMGEEFLVNPPGVMARHHQQIALPQPGLTKVLLKQVAAPDRRSHVPDDGKIQ